MQMKSGTIFKVVFNVYINFFRFIRPDHSPLLFSFPVTQECQVIKAQNKHPNIIFYLLLAGIASIALTHIPWKPYYFNLGFGYGLLSAMADPPALLHSGTVKCIPYRYDITYGPH